MTQLLSLLLAPAFLSGCKKASSTEWRGVGDHVNWAPGIKHNINKK
jgi:hypothetical protein